MFCFELSVGRGVGSKVPSLFVPSSCVRDEHVCKQISSAFFATERGEHDQTHYKHLQIPGPGCKINGPVNALHCSREMWSHEKYVMWDLGDGRNSHQGLQHCTLKEGGRGEEMASHHCRVFLSSRHRASNFSLINFLYQNNFWNIIVRILVWKFWINVMETISGGC